MSEVQTPPAAAGAAGTSAPVPVKKKKKGRAKKIVKTVITVLVILGLLGGGGFSVWWFVFRPDDGPAKGEPLYDTAYIGSISSSVRGYGSANAKSSASITLSQNGVVDQIFVSQGQMVYEGDPLYVVSSPEAQKALEEARETYANQQASVSKIQEEMAALRKSRGDLNISAPHAGKLTDVADIKVGDPLGAGTAIARIVDDTRLKLSLYYSYAYEDDIYVGKDATVTVPAVGIDLVGTVEKINKVRMITPEGGINFEAVIVVDNPGTLTEGMGASAAMADAAGSPIFPYESGSFVYYQTTTVATVAAGPVEQVADLINYADVTAGQLLLVQGTASVDELIRQKQEQLDTALATLEQQAQTVQAREKELQNFSAVSPITGMVVALNLFEGQEVTAGSTSVTIADNSVMTVNIQVDDRNRQYVSEGMEMTLNDYYGNSYIGIVDSIAVIGENQNGVTVYPAVLRVDNPTGTLMGGYGLNYNFITSQSEGCILIPSGDIRYYTPEGADEPQGVVYVKLQEDREPPAVTIDKSQLPSEMQAQIPADCVVVAVETGLTDEGQAEIKSGLTEGDLVWNSTPNEDNNYNSWG